MIDELNKLINNIADPMSLIDKSWEEMISEIDIKRENLILRLKEENNLDPNSDETNYPKNVQDQIDKIHDCSEEMIKIIDKNRNDLVSNQQQQEKKIKLSSEIKIYIEFLVFFRNYLKNSSKRDSVLDDINFIDELKTQIVPYFDFKTERIIFEKGKLFSEINENNNDCFANDKFLLTKFIDCQETYFLDVKHYINYNPIFEVLMLENGNYLIFYEHSDIRYRVCIAIYDPVTDKLVRKRETHIFETLIKSIYVYSEFILVCSAFETKVFDFKLKTISKLDDRLLLGSSESDLLFMKLNKENPIYGRSSSSESDSF